MKKVLSAVLALAMSASMLTVSAFAMKGGDDHGKVPATDTAITVDGKKDAIYDKGLSVKIATPLASKKAEMTSGCTGEAKVVWNGKDTLYIYAEVKDTTFVSSDAAQPTTPWSTDDSIECFIDPKNDGAKRHQLAMTAKGAGYSWITKLEYDAATIKTIGYEKWAAVKTATGYSYEWQINLATAGVETKDGSVFGFGFQINDNVAGKRQQYVSNSKGGEDIKDFGFVTLSATKVAPDAPKPAANPSTADASAVAVAAAVCALGAAVVAKKKH